MSTEAVNRECQDCGDDLQPNERRRRCSACGKLVCGWCMNHVHGPAHAKARADREAQP